MGGGERGIRDQGASTLVVATLFLFLPLSHDRAQSTQASIIGTVKDTAVKFATVMAMRRSSSPHI
jgi:hypothetical protein